MLICSGDLPILLEKKISVNVLFWRLCQGHLPLTVRRYCLKAKACRFPPKEDVAGTYHGWEVTSKGAAWAQAAGRSWWHLRHVRPLG